MAQGITIYPNLPESIVKDNPEPRFSESAKLIMERKYLIRDEALNPIETLKQRIIRMSQMMAEPERKFGGDEAFLHWLGQFYDVISKKDFSPGGRNWSNAGTNLLQLFNCFVYGIPSGLNGFMKTLTDTALTHKEGGGTGFNFSLIAPKNVEVDGYLSPGSVISIDNIDVETETICQGNRRGANMGVLDFDHPDILDFVFAKRDRREVRKLNKFSDHLSGYVCTIFDALKLDYSTEEIKTDIDEIIDSNLTQENDAKKIGIVVKKPKNLENLVEGEEFEIIDPITSRALILDDLEMYADNVRKNKAALGPDAINPLSVSDGKVICNYSGNIVGREENGNIIMNYSAILRELESMGIEIVDGSYSFEGKSLITMEDDLKSIFNSVGKSTKEHSRRRKTVVDFSKLRPKGSPVRGGSAISSGLRSFVRNYDTASWMYSQEEGDRENIAVVSLDHPDVLDIAYLMTLHWDINKPLKFAKSIAAYVREKAEKKYGKEISQLDGLETNLIKIIRKMPKDIVREAHKLKNFNISVNIRDESFMEALGNDGYIPLQYNGVLFTIDDLEKAINNSKKSRTWLGDEAEPSLILEGEKVINNYSGKEIGKVEDGIIKLHAKTLFDLIIENAHATADPGLLLGFNANKDSFLKGAFYGASNPCGEIWLYLNESCNLGSINLANMVKSHKGKWALDEKKLARIAMVGQRYLDNVHDANKGPIPEVEESSQMNRRTGLGVMGWANLLAKLYIPYDSEEALELAGRVGKIISEASLEESIEIAKEKGPFPNFKNTTYDQNVPLRNIARLAVAPTGTISMLFDVNSSIEPFFSLNYEKRMRGGDAISYSIEEFEEVAKKRGFYSDILVERIKLNHGSIQTIEEIPEDVRRVFKTSHDIDYRWHIRTQEVFQRYMDNAVSKTINMPSSSTPEDVREAYILAMKSGLKGITVYRDGCRDEQILVA